MKWFNTGKIFMYKTYVMHYTPLKDRREFINQQLLLKGIFDAEFITQFDREDLKEQDLARYNKDIEAHKNVCEISLKAHGFADEIPYKYETMNLPSISLNLKHLHAFKRFLNQDMEFGLFLEDDCRFVDSLTSVDSVIENAPKGWDVIFLGGAFNHNICSYGGMYQWKGYTYMNAKHPATNTTSSILYKKQSVRKILPHMESFCTSIDWQLNYAFYKEKLNVYHTYPYLCTQGDFRSTAKDV